MNNERVKPKIAAKELQMDVITLRELMKREKLPIGYAVKREGKSKWGFYIYRHLLDQEDTKMLYTEKEKHEIERVKEVFAEHLRQSPDFELLWSDKVGYVWLTIGVNPVYVDTGIRIESAADLCGKCLDDVATDVLYMTGNDHALEAADPLELAEIKRRWEPYINQLPEYAYICDDLLSGRK